MVYLIMLAGLIVGVMLFEAEGIIPGLLLGYLFFRSNEDRRKLRDLETKLEAFDTPMKSPVPEVSSSAGSAPASVIAHDTVKDNVVIEEKAPVAASPEPIATASKPELDIDREKEAPVETPAFSNPVPGQDVLSDVLQVVQHFFTSGNLFVKLGIAVLFVGLSFLIKAVVEGGFLPIEFRLLGAALTGTGLIALGRRLTKKRRNYGLTLQGGGIAILYLTIFASYKLYALLDAPLAFALMVVVTIAGTALALWQNTQSLAVISILGGFAAPFVISTGSGDHVTLFFYYSIINAGILCMAWQKPWRAVRLTGFFSTLIAGIAWGATSYKPELFASTQPFAIVFFLNYLGIALLYALRHGLKPTKLIDGPLVFGLPVVAFSIQAALTGHFEYGMAWSSFALGATYLLVAAFIYQLKNENLKTLLQAFIGIGIAGLSMTIPFALGATWTATGWALEGAALIWLGIKQQRFLVRTGGLALIVLAVGSFFYGLENTTFEAFEAFQPMFNPSYLGFLTLSVASLFAGYQIYKNKEVLYKYEAVLGTLLLGAGLAWWMAGGYEEIRRNFDFKERQNLQILFTAGSTLGFVMLGKLKDWRPLSNATLLSIPLFFWFLMVNFIMYAHPFESWGSIIWILGIGSVYAALYFSDKTSGKLSRTLGHATALWLVMLLVGAEAIWLMDEWTSSATSWAAISVLLSPLLIITLVSHQSVRNHWPIGKHASIYLKVALIPVIMGTWMALMGIGFYESGNTPPLPFIPVLNPLDVAFIIACLATLYWYRCTIQRIPDFLSTNAKAVGKWALIVAAFLWMNTTIGRTVHHWGDVAYTEQLMDSSAFQSALSICWTLLALTSMTYAARQGKRIPWLVSAALLAVVVVKLFVVDLSNLTTIHRVISFIGVGTLLLIIGYVAPVPPKAKAYESQESVV
ncbi:MAG: DUF2339 domain-containing protein [Bacteroidota bacterium]